MKLIQKTLLAGAVIVAAAGVWAVGSLDGGSAIAAAPAAAAVRNVGGLDDAAGGTVTGTILYEGPTPAQRPNAAAASSADPACKARLAQGPILEETWVFGDKKGAGVALQNVFVYVSKGLEGKTFPVPKTVAHINQVGCTYLPHVQGVMAGQDLWVENGEATLHNVHIQGKPELNGDRNIAQPGKGVIEKLKFAKVESPVPIKCDVHSWMTTYVHVMSHPFFAVTAADGTFTLKGLPPGKYEVSVWHEYSRFKPDKASATVEVKGGATADKIDFTFKPG